MHNIIFLNLKQLYSLVLSVIIVLNNYNIPKLFSVVQARYSLKCLHINMTFMYTTPTFVTEALCFVLLSYVQVFSMMLKVKIITYTILF